MRFSTFIHSYANSPFVELSSTLFPSVQVTNPGDETVVGTSAFCAVAVVVLSVVVKLSGLEEAACVVFVVVVTTSSPFVIGEDEALVDVLVVDSVTGFLFDVDAAVLFGRFVVLRLTDVDLTVEEVFTVGLEVVEGFMLAVELVVFSSESTENVVTSISSEESVVGSTFTM